MNVSDWPLYHYEGTVLRVVDGDTIRVRCSFGMRVSRETNVRLAGIDAPEINSGDGAERERGQAARVALDDFFYDDVLVYLRTYKDRQSFDRYVADVFVADQDGNLIDVAAEMVALGHAVRSEWRVTDG